MHLKTVSHMSFQGKKHGSYFDTNVCRELDSSQMNEVTVTATELKQRGF